MSEINSITGSQRLISQPRVSLETTGQTPSISPSVESQKMEKMTLEMEKMQHAFGLMQEIRSSLEAALDNLSPN
jgi:hypothetical protein